MSDEHECRDGFVSECWLCRTEALPIGVLGSTLHYNCRTCGLWWNRPLNDEERNDYTQSCN